MNRLCNSVDDGPLKIKSTVPLKSNTLQLTLFLEIKIIVTGKPLILNTSEEFIKCRFLMESRKYLVFILNI